MTDREWHWARVFLAERPGEPFMWSWWTRKFGDFLSGLLLRAHCDYLSIYGLVSVTGCH